MKRWLVIAVLFVVGVVPLALLATAAWLASTESGTRFLLARAAPHLPAALSLADVSGTLAGTLRIGALRWRDETARVVVSDVVVEAALGRVLDRIVVVERLDVGSVDIALLRDDRRDPAPPGRPSFTVDLPLRLDIGAAVVGPVTLGFGGAGEPRELLRRAEIAGRWSGTRVQLSRLALAAPAYAAAAAGELRLAPPYRADLALSWAYSPDAEQVLHGALALGGTLDRYRLGHRLQAPVVVDSAGTVRYDDLPRLDLTHRWSSLAVPLPDGRTLVLGDGTLTTAGPLADIGVSLSTGLTLDPVGPLDLDVRGAVRAGELVVRAAEVRADGMTLGADGSLRLGADGVDWDLDIDGRALNLAVLDRRLPSSLNLSAGTAGALPGWREPRFELSLTRLDGRFRERPLSGSGAVAYADDAGRVEALDLALGNNRLLASGSVAAELALALSVEAAALAELWPGLDGSLNGELKLSGDWRRPLVDGGLTGTGLRFGDIRADRVELVADRAAAAGQRVSVDVRSLAAGEFVVERGSLVASGTAGSHTLNATVTLPSLTLAAALGGGFDAATPAWAGQLREFELGVTGAQPLALVEPVALSLSPARQRVAALCLAAPDAGEACLDVESELHSGDLALRGRLRALPLGLLAARLSDVAVDGTLDADVDLNWQGGRVDGSAGLNLREASFALLSPDGTRDEAIPLVVSASATVRAGRLDAEADIGVGDSGRGRVDLALDDLLDRASPIDAALSFDLDDIAFVSVFLPGVEVDAGTFDAQASIGGTLAEPLPSGSATIRGAELLVDASGTQVRELDVSIEPAGNRRLAYRGTARVGDGRLGLDGWARIAAGGRWETTLAVDGDRAELVRLPDWSVTASPDLTVAYADGRVDVAGAIAVPAASVTLDDLPDQAVTASGDAVVHGEGGADTGGLAYRLDLTVSAGDAVRLSGFGLETGLTGDLRLNGSDQQGLRGIGVLNLVDGRFEAYGQSLDIERGRLNFTGSLTNPLLDFRAVRGVGDVRVGMQMAGSVESPRSSLFSEPPLTEADTLSYLLTGRPLSAAGSGDGSLLNSAALALGLSQAGKIAAEISASLGLDELGIEGSGEDGRLLAGKWLGDSLYLQYAYGIFDKLGSLLVRLSLSERLTLETRSGQQQSLDLVYSVGRD